MHISPVLNSPPGSCDLDVINCGFDKCVNLAMPCPSTVYKMYFVGSNFLGRTKKFITLGANSKSVAPTRKL